MESRIEYLAEKKLAGKRITTSFTNNRTAELWRSFMPERKKIQHAAGTALYSLQVYQPFYFEQFNPDAEFEKWAATEVTCFDALPEGMEPFLLNGGLYAVFHYHGAASAGATAFQFIMQTWLPASGYLLDDRPHFEILGEKYKGEDPDSEEEIWIPVRLPEVKPEIDAYIKSAGKWQAEVEKLRMILHACPLDETLKWGVPCYTFQNANIVLIHVFKEYCALLFFKGALLKDSHGMLVEQSKNVQAGRQVRFTGAGAIDALAAILKAYVFEAIEVEKAGLKVSFKKTEEFAKPEEFQRKLDEFPTLKTAFESLTPGRQRAYLLFFSAPKQSKTREARVEKYIPMILEGKGLND